ncbi:hypothetical protein LAUMK4_02512 [Mycobacterium persicum]|uniref:Uncharacterized protein n=1 Tax=Mycobacterium persicum TaxID=1487726 RepID=A0ABY6RID5_9MYCO|nr:hypothetical protein BST40_22415 [Mycobacterium persicum]VAZ75517.1 hypothetical protein LAUMK15_02838 [Mycobacterium persicum]VAZ93606.1 hypothetical protein LAUMK4_02512 [Mycobacterium persicum]
MNTGVVARSRIREAVLTLLATGTWEPWPTIVGVVSQYTGAPPELVERALWRLWRTGAIDIRGRGHRRQAKTKERRPS